MKTYIYYFDGVEQGILRASSHNAAEKKAQALMAAVNCQMPFYASRFTLAIVAYTEI